MKNGLILLLALGLTVSLVLHWRWSRAVFGEPPSPPPKEATKPKAENRFAVIEEALAAARKQPGLTAATIGFCLIDGAGAVVYEHDARIAQIPASSFKTLTTATALEKLGADFRLETALGITESPNNGVMAGDVVILGGGDPMLAMEDFHSWAEELAASGWTEVSGRIIGDGRFFSGSIYPDFWNWGDIGNGYGSGVSGLNLDHNRFAAIFQPGTEEGAPATVTHIAPEVGGVIWWNQVVTGLPGSGDGVVIHGGERASVMYLRGTVPLNGGPIEVKGAVPDPERFAAQRFREALEGAGIAVTGEAWGAGDLLMNGETVPDPAEIRIHHLSPTLLEIVTSIHATSDNLETECLFQLLGLREGKPSDEVISEHWAGRGLVFSGLRMVDGSGLARADQITPHDLARLQDLAGRGRASESYRHSLLTREGNALSWKGGAMSAIRSYTGFATGVSGEKFSYALMVNHHSDGKAVDELRDAIWAAILAL